MRNRLLLILLVFFLLVVPAFSIQPSQQYAKLFYSPYYVASMTQNQNTTFSFTISPPDGFSGTQSAVLNFQVYAMPSVTFTLYVNDKACVPASFYISTSYAGASLLPFSFDCSNVVNHTGTYIVKLSPSKDTGAGYGWLDITYSNRPQDSRLTVHGTEYRVGDIATSFVSIIDSNQAPVNNAVCYLDLYAPYSYNITHTEILDNQLMFFKEEGMYYYDYFIPTNASTGVYMMNIRCRYAQSIRLYSSDDLFNSPNLTSTTLLTGSNQVLNSYEDSLYILNAHSGNDVVSNFTFKNLTTYTNLSSIIFSLFYQSEDPGTMTASFWNWTSSRFESSSTVSLAGSAGADPDKYDEYRSFNINSTNVSKFIQNGTVRVGINTTNSKKMFWNAAYLTFVTYDLDSYPPDIRGSGEIHVSSQNYSVDLSSVLSGQDKIISNITSVNDTLHSSTASNFTNTNNIVYSMNATLHSSIISNFINTNNIIYSTNATLHSDLSKYFNFTQNVSMNLTGSFTQLEQTTSVTKAIMLALIVIGVIYFLWRMFK